jgi:hypothetical protein
MQTKIIPTLIKFEPVTISIKIDTLGELTALFAHFNLSTKVVREHAFRSNTCELAKFCLKHADFSYVDTGDNPFDTLYDLVRKYLEQERGAGHVQTNST